MWHFSAHITGKKTDWNFLEMLSKMYLLSRKSPLNFEVLDAECRSTMDSPLHSLNALVGWFILVIMCWCADNSADIESDDCKDTWRVAKPWCRRRHRSNQPTFQQHTAAYYDIQTATQQQRLSNSLWWHWNVTLASAGCIAFVSIIFLHLS